MSKLGSGWLKLLHPIINSLPIVFTLPLKLIGELKLVQYSKNPLGIEESIEPRAIGQSRLGQAAQK